jgi:hypothetical protein
MTLNHWLLLFYAVLAAGSVLLLRWPEASQRLYDRRLFWGALAY